MNNLPQSVEFRRRFLATAKSEFRHCEEMLREYTERLNASREAVRASDLWLMENDPEYAAAREKALLDAITKATAPA